MKDIGTFLRSILISPELLVSVAGLALCMLFPNWFTWLSEQVRHQAEVLKYVGFLPAGLIAFDLKMGKSILLPDADKRKILQNWPRYRDLKCGVVVSLLYGVIFALGGVATLLFEWSTPEARQSAVLATSVVGSLTVSATLFFAHIKVEELFRHHLHQEPLEG